MSLPLQPDDIESHDPDQISHHIERYIRDIDQSAWVWFILLLIPATTLTKRMVSAEEASPRLQCKGGYQEDDQDRRYYRNDFLANY